MAKKHFHQLNEKISDYLVNIAKLSANLEESRRENVQLTKEIESCKKKIDLLKHERDQLNNDIQEMKHRFDEMQA
ncbi:MAG: hypothetical protein KDC05_04310 [Bacteroidales bacterium]|nr:hypothetical protein [Bacteroidales bacterium]